MGLRSKKESVFECRKRLASAIPIPPKKEPEKLETKRGGGKAGIHELLITFLLAGQSCAIKLGFAPDYGRSILPRFIRRKD
jgi:hypothetical protein